jgi:competence protein ComEC
VSTAFRHWRNYLLLFSTISYGAGIVTSASFLPPAGVLPCLLILSVLGCLIFTAADRWVWTVSTLALLFFLFGTVQGNRYRIRAIDDHDIGALVTHPQQAIIIGTMAKMVSSRDGISNTRIKVSYLRTSESDTYLKATGKIVLSVRGDWPAEILAGQSIGVRATLQPAPANNVPGAFNYRQYLARNKIYVTGWVQSPLLIQRVAPLERSSAEMFGYAIERLRFFIGEQIHRSLPGGAGALYRALLIGDRSTIQRDHYEILKRAGILHILAISGMHLGLLAALAYAALYWLLRRCASLLILIDARKCALFLVLPLLLIYALLAGFQPPVVRSLIMSGGLIIGYGVNRLQSPLTALSLAALLILLFDPMAIESPAFQLSFAAVTAIFLLTPKINQCFDSITVYRSKTGERVKKFIVTLAAVNVAAALGTFPLMLVHFNRSSLVALPANLMIEPLVCLFSLPIGFISIPFMFLIPDLADFLLSIGGHGLNLAMIIAAWLSAPGSTQLWLPAPPAGLCFLYYLALVVIIVVEKVSVRLLAIASFTAAVTAFMLPLSGFSFTERTNSTVSVIDVGHGSAHIIEMKNGRVAVIDAGAKSRPGYDCGAQLIAPFLWFKGIGKIDDIILTHDDSDHYSGISALIERFNPDRLWIPTLASHKPGFDKLLKQADQASMRIISPQPGIIIQGGMESISVIGSSWQAPRENRASYRDSSHGDDNGLVLKFSSAHTSILFPGDITKKREQAMVNAGLDLKSDILLSPHHGSSSSNSYDFLRMVDPDYIIFSSGDARNIRFPNRQTLATVEQLGIAALNTARDGTIIVKIAEADEGSPNYRINSYNVSEKTFWRQS